MLISLRFLFLTSIFLGAVTTLAGGDSYSIPNGGVAATNAISTVQMEQRGNTAYLTYTLPPDLIGPEAAPMHMKIASLHHDDEDGYSLKFKDDYGWSVCQERPYGFSCVSDYDGLKIDTEARENFLKTSYAGDPLLLQNKIAAAKMFSSDPVGLLKIHCPQRLCGLDIGALDVQ